MLPFVFEHGIGFERYVDYVLDVPMYFVYRDGHYLDATGQSFRDFMEGKLPALPGEMPTMGDWVDHMTTAFPEVRLKRYLEMRGADGGPWDRLCALPAFWVGLLYDRQALDAASDVVKGWTVEELEALRREVPRQALEAVFRGRKLRDWSRDLLRIARDGLTRRRRLDRMSAATRATSSTPSTASPIPAGPRPRRCSSSTTGGGRARSTRSSRSSRTRYTPFRHQVAHSFFRHPGESRDPGACGKLLIMWPLDPGFRRGDDWGRRSVISGLLPAPSVFSMKRSMRRLAHLLLLLALMPLAAKAAMQGENLLVPPMPAGWVRAYGAQGNGINMVEYVPPGQTLDSWSEMINVEVFHGRGGSSPDALQQQVSDGFKVNCESLHVDGLGRGTTSGLPAGALDHLLRQGETDRQGRDHLLPGDQRQGEFLCRPARPPDSPLRSRQAALRSRDACGLAEVLR